MSFQTETRKPAMESPGIALLCRRHKTSLWGQPYIVTPRLVDWIHGDGLQVIYLEPLNTRPNYYIARIDSRVNMSNWAEPPVFCDEVLDELLFSIEDQYGRSEEDWEAENGRTYHRHNYFPALSEDAGCCWGQLARLKTPDQRTEDEIRQALRASLFKREAAKSPSRKAAH